MSFLMGRLPNSPCKGQQRSCCSLHHHITVMATLDVWLMKSGSHGCIFVSTEYQGSLQRQGLPSAITSLSSQVSDSGEARVWSIPSPSRPPCNLCLCSTPSVASPEASSVADISPVIAYILHTLLWMPPDEDTSSMQQLGQHHVWPLMSILA